MATFSGSISYIQIADTTAGDQVTKFAKIGLIPTDGSPAENLLLWTSTVDARDVPNSVDWLLRGMQMSLLRDALERSLLVFVSTAADNGNIVSSVTLLSDSV
jgi:hypothetical protein